MAAAPDPWASIKAAFLAEGDGAAIARARELGIRTLEVIPYIREWKAAKAPPPAPVTIDVAPSSVVISESGESVAREQKRLSSQLRGVLEHELEETQMMARITSSFTDAETIEKLREKALAGDSKPLAEHLLNAAKARKVVVEHVEKLARAINQAVQCERAVWGLDSAKGAEAAATNWENVLADLRKPLAPLALPDHVIDFESKVKLRSIEGGRRGRD